MDMADSAPGGTSSAPGGGYGTTLANGPLGGEVTLNGDLGDQQAAMVGQVCLAPGEAKNTYGTGNFMLLNTGTELIPSKSGLLTTAAYGLRKGECIYALEGSIAITGASTAGAGGASSTESMLSHSSMSSS